MIVQSTLSSSGYRGNIGDRIDRNVIAVSSDYENRLFVTNPRMRRNVDLEPIDDMARFLVMQGNLRFFLLLGSWSIVVEPKDSGSRWLRRVHVVHSRLSSWTVNRAYHIFLNAYGIKT